MNIAFRPWFTEIFKIGLSITWVLLSGLALAQDDSKQALEQLRLLQKQMTQNAGETPPRPPAQRPASADNQESDQSAVASVPAQNENTGTLSESQEDLVDEKAFETTKRQLFPLSPEQIIDLRREHDSQKLAKITTVDAPPRPTATSQFVNLSPGSTPPVVRLAQGFVSSLVFLDSTGAPWPISAYDLGDPSAFNIQWDKTSNTMMIQALKLYTYGNLAIRLRSLNTPVMITLIPGQKAVDYRVDMRIQGIGPNAKSLPLEVGLPPSANDILLHILDGVPPPGSERLIVSGGDARAWLYKNRMYVRTNLTILSPGWIGSMTSADGMHAFEMQKAPVLLVSWHGKVMQLKIEGL